MSYLGSLDWKKIKDDAPPRDVPLMVMAVHHECQTMKKYMDEENGYRFARAYYRGYWDIMGDVGAGYGCEHLSEITNDNSNDIELWARIK